MIGYKLGGEVSVVGVVLLLVAATLQYDDKDFSLLCCIQAELEQLLKRVDKVLHL